MDQPFTRRPHFEAGCTCAWDMNADPVAMTAHAEAATLAAVRAQEGGRWIPPTGLPPSTR